MFVIKTITYQLSNHFDAVNVYCAFSKLGQNGFQRLSSFVVLVGLKLVDELKDAFPRLQNDSQRKMTNERRQLMNPRRVPLTKCALIRCKQRALKFAQFTNSVTLNFIDDVCCKRLLVLTFDALVFLKIRITSAYSGRAWRSQAWHRLQNSTNATGSTNQNNGVHCCGSDNPINPSTTVSRRSLPKCGRR